MPSHAQQMDNTTQPDPIEALEATDASDREEGNGAAGRSVDDNESADDLGESAFLGVKPDPSQGNTIDKWRSSYARWIGKSK